MKKFEKKWTGTWKDIYGYCIRISFVNNTIKFERSGDIGSKLQFECISNDGSVLTFTEKGNDINYKHILKNKSETEIEDNWFDLDTNSLWQVNKLFHSSVLIEKEKNLNSDKDISVDESVRLVKNSKKFDQYQHRLAELIVKEIYNLTGVYVKGEEQVQLTDNIAFSICSLLDGTIVSKVGMKDFTPNITFSLDSEGKKILISERGSWMHEYAIGLIDCILEEQ